MLQWYHTGTSITRYHQGDDDGARDDPMMAMVPRWYKYHQVSRTYTLEGDDDVVAMIDDPCVTKP